MNTMNIFAIMSMGGPELIIGMFLLILIPATIFLYFWALIHCLKNQKIEGSKKSIWIITILFIPLIGSLIYLTNGKKKVIENC